MTDMTEIQVFSIVTLVAVIALVIYQIVLRIKLIKDLPITEDECELISDEHENLSCYPCGSYQPHHEDFINSLHTILQVGKIYETIAYKETDKCKKEEGKFCLAWIRSYNDDKCCGVNEIVGFDKMPPKHFVFSLDHKIIEVVK